MISFAKTFKHEGGFVSHPRDPGGATKHGISARAFRNIFGFEPTADQMRMLTLSAAELIARVEYYERPGFDKLPDGPIAEQVFDIGFNMGPHWGWKLLQRALGVVDDGIFGPMSWRAYDAADKSTLNSRLVDERIKRYRDINNGAFMRGWISRAESFR